MRTHLRIHMEKGRTEDDGDKYVQNTSSVREGGKGKYSMKHRADAHADAEVAHTDDQQTEKPGKKRERGGGGMTQESRAAVISYMTYTIEHP